MHLSSRWKISRCGNRLPIRETRWLPVPMRQIQSEKEMTESSKMTEAQFSEPLQYLEGALGGPPKEMLVRWLLVEFGTTDPNVWRRACHILAHGNKPSHFLVGQDFVLAVSKAREQEISFQKQQDARDHRRQSEQHADPVRPIKESATLFRRTLVDTIKKATSSGQRRWLEERLKEYDQKQQEGS